MTKSFDRNIQTKLKIRDGQSVWANMLKRISGSAMMRTDSNVEMRCYPYAKQVIGLDFCKNIDADPLHTSLPTGTYDGVNYTHSDTCLSALYPDLASALKPTVEWFINTNIQTVSTVTVTLVIDAIGALIAAGSEIYAVALDTARSVSGFRTVDETDFSLGAFLFATVMGDDNYLDRGRLDGNQDTDPNKVIITTNSYNKSDQITATNNLATRYSVGQSYFDSNINAYLNNVFITPTLKGVIELLCSNIIKYRYADADTNRYVVFGSDAYMAAYSDPSAVNAALYIKNLADNHVQVILNRYKFMADLMRNLGFVRLNGAKPRRVNGEADTSKGTTNRIVLNTANNNINIVYDSADVIKNVVDHNLINADEIMNSLHGTNPLVYPLTVYQGYIFTESDSYLNNELEINDSLLMDDGIITVLLHNGMRAYNTGFIDFYKANNSSVAQVTYSLTYPKPLLFTSGTSLPATTSASVQAINELYNNTSLLDATWIPVFTVDTGIIRQEFEHINTGINTYGAPVDDVQLIDSYAVTFICFDHKKIADNNQKLSENPDSNNNAS